MSGRPQEALSKINNVNQRTFPSATCRPLFTPKDHGIQRWPRVALSVFLPKPASQHGRLTIGSRSSLTLQSFIVAVQRCGAGWYNARCVWLALLLQHIPSKRKERIPPSSLCSPSSWNLSIVITSLPHKWFWDTLGNFRLTTAVCQDVISGYNRKNIGISVCRKFVLYLAISLIPRPPQPSTCICIWKA